MPDPRPVSPTDYDAFYATYRNYVNQVLYRAGYPGDLHDGMQRTFLKFWERRGHYKPNGESGWLTILGTIATRVASDERNKCANRSSLHEPYVPSRDPRISPDPTPEQGVLAKERARLLNRLLADLDPCYRSAVLAYRVHEIPPVEIGGPGEENRGRRRAWWWMAYRACLQMRRAIEQDPDTYGPLIPAALRHKYVKGEPVDDPTPRIPAVPAGPDRWNRRLGGRDPGRR